VDGREAADGSCAGINFAGRRRLWGARAIRAHILRIDADDTTVPVLAKGKTRMGRRGDAIICKIRYLTSQTVSDTTRIAVTLMIARSAFSPSSPAPSARRHAAWELDRLARPSKSGDRSA
jgi:hypothetical protein